MGINVISIESDTVEAICYRKYGYTEKITTQVYENNPGLAALGVVLPIGTKLTLPDVPKKNDLQTQNLWD